MITEQFAAYWTEDRFISHMFSDTTGHYCALGAIFDGEFLPEELSYELRQLIDMPVPNDVQQYITHQYGDKTINRVENSFVSASFIQYVYLNDFCGRDAVLDALYVMENYEPV